MPTPTDPRQRKDFLRDRLAAVSLVPEGRYLVKLLPQGIAAF